MNAHRLFNLLLAICAALSLGVICWMPAPTYTARLGIEPAPQPAQAALAMDICGPGADVYWRERDGELMCRRHDGKGKPATAGVPAKRAR